MLNIYTVHDQASNTYVKPFLFLTDRDAIEGFRHVCNDEKTPYAQHPADYNLCSLGNFDEQSGILTPSAPHILKRAVDLIPKKLTKEQINDQIEKLKIDLEEMQ
jgi:hypothetical protein